MNKQYVAVAFSALCAFAVFSARAEERAAKENANKEKAPISVAPTGFAKLADIDGNDAGKASFLQTPQGVIMRVDLRLPDGEHGLHIHENGECALPDFKSAGGHFNPDGHKHGFLSPEGAHAGDLPNVTVENKRYVGEVFLHGFTLEGERGIANRAIVVHSGADDYSTDPAGDAGDRIACGVIQETAQQTSDSKEPK
ncbi:MAG: superoxide dismutase family protein [Rickettsiales bacterium]